MNLKTSIVRRLIKTAKKSDVIKCKVAAIAISQSGEVITHANNRTCRGPNKKWTYHAEEMLIRKLNKLKAFDRFRGKITVIILRLDKQERIRDSKPCDACQEFLIPYLNKLSIYFTTDGGFKRKYNG